MRNNQIYRSAVTFFFVAIIAQVFVLQSIHHIFGHHTHDQPCNIGDTHIHSAEHGHFSCDICFFNLNSPQFDLIELRIDLPKVFVVELNEGIRKFDFDEKYFTSFLRGPPNVMS